MREAILRAGIRQALHGLSTFRDFRLIGVMFALEEALGAADDTGPPLIDRQDAARVAHQMDAPQ